MEKNYISVEDIILSAQGSFEDFPINGIYLVTNAVENTTRYGKPYYNLVLKDKTGTFRAVRFTTGEEEFEPLKNIYMLGYIVEIEGTYQNKWDSVKVITEKLVENSNCEFFDFEEPSDINIDALSSILFDTIDLIENEYLKSLLKLVFTDKEIRQLYFDCPSSVGMHHSYKHGNLEHVVNMIKLFQIEEQNYKNTYKLDRDLVYTGIILHDIGKTKVYSVRNGIPILNNGNGLVGHFYLGVDIVSEYIRKMEVFPQELATKINHLILSHHGSKEYGSPVEPKIPEAEILHLLDFLDAKLASLII